jgi:hypothetical protein
MTRLGRRPGVRDCAPVDDVMAWRDPSVALGLSLVERFRMTTWGDGFPIKNIESGKGKDDRSRLARKGQRTDSFGDDSIKATALKFIETKPAYEFHLASQSRQTRKTSCSSDSLPTRSGA